MTEPMESPKICATCQTPLNEPYAHCGNCRADYCLVCGAAHFCTASCQANGCLAGLCVRIVTDGNLSPKWGVPAAMLERAKAG